MALTPGILLTPMINPPARSPPPHDDIDHASTISKLRALGKDSEAAPKVGTDFPSTAFSTAPSSSSSSSAFSSSMSSFSSSMSSFSSSVSANSSHHGNGAFKASAEEAIHAAYSTISSIPISSSSVAPSPSTVSYQASNISGANTSSSVAAASLSLSTEAAAAALTPHLASAISAAIASVLQPAAAALGPAALQTVLQQLQHSLAQPTSYSTVDSLTPAPITSSSSATLRAGIVPAFSNLVSSEAVASSVAPLSQLSVPLNHCLKPLMYVPGGSMLAAPHSLKVATPLSSAQAVNSGTSSKATSPTAQSIPPALGSTVFGPSITSVPLASTPMSEKTKIEASNQPPSRLMGSAAAQFSSASSRTLSSSTCASAVPKSSALSRTLSVASASGEEGDASLIPKCATKRPRLESGDMQMLAWVCEQARAAEPTEVRNRKIN